MLSVHLFVHIRKCDRSTQVSVESFHRGASVGAGIISYGFWSLSLNLLRAPLFFNFTVYGGGWALGFFVSFLTRTREPSSFGLLFLLSIPACFWFCDPLCILLVHLSPVSIPSLIFVLLVYLLCWMSLSNDCLMPLLGIPYCPFPPCYGGYLCLSLKIWSQIFHVYLFVLVSKLYGTRLSLAAITMPDKNKYKTLMV